MKSANFRKTSSLKSRFLKMEEHEYRNLFEATTIFH